MVEGHRDRVDGVLATPALLQVQVYDILRRRIAGCAAGYEPGSQINLTRIAEEFGISITPVKDALRRLQADGLAETRPRQGIFVRALSAADLRDLLVVRRGLEALAVDVFVPPLDPALSERMGAALDAWESERRRGDAQTAYRHHLDFHALVVAAGGNRMLTQVYERLHAHVEIAFVYYVRSFNQSDDELMRHRLLHEALARGDIEEARLRLAEHYRLGHPVVAADGEVPLAALQPGHGRRSEGARASDGSATGRGTVRRGPASDPTGA